MTSRELVLRTMEFENLTERAPRMVALLPWALIHHRPEVEKLMADFTSDLTLAPNPLLKPSAVQKGNAFQAGDYTDEWGCHFLISCPA